MNKVNPFNVVKAGDFSDKQINEFWVDFPGDKGFDSLAKPTSTMPLIIKGGKGSGKTHLMRHYSFQLQQLRHPDNIAKGIQSDGYLGTYLKLGGLNTKRFSGKKIDDDEWLHIFAYYLDIWLSQLLIDNIINTFPDAKIKNEESICTKITQLFDQEITLEDMSLKSLSSFLHKSLREIDLKVNNCLWEPLNIKILSSPGRLIFGIPKIIAANVNELQETIFVYLVDELENLFEFQQKYIQTLIREKELPCSIKIGARSHGIKTYETLAAGEFNKEGSEFELIILEFKIRETKNYEDFAKKLCIKRLKAEGYISNSNADSNCSLDNFFNEVEAYAATDNIVNVDSGIEGKVIKKLSQQLQKHKLQKYMPKILNNLCYEDMPLIEKAAVYCFYNDWSKNFTAEDIAEKLTFASEMIVEEVTNYLNGARSNNRISRALDHYKIDFISQLTPNQKKRELYSGLKNIIKISDGFPRNLLTIFKHIFVYAEFNGERPFEEGKISKKSQVEGILEATEWFVNDARMTGRDGNRLKIAISRLSEIFRLNRMADKPRECSLITFSVNEENISPESKRLIEIATQWSLLLGDNKGRKDRNSKRIDPKYKLNYMLSPYWELPIASRGVYAMPPGLIDSIFDENFDANYQSEKNKFMNSLSPPFGISKKNHPTENTTKKDTNQGSLF